jgi:hypothetical protein
MSILFRKIPEKYLNAGKGKPFKERFFPSQHPNPFQACLPFHLIAAAIIKYREFQLFVVAQFIARLQERALALPHP